MTARPADSAATADDLDDAINKNIAQCRAILQPICADRTYTTMDETALGEQLHLIHEKLAEVEALSQALRERERVAA